MVAGIPPYFSTDKKSLLDNIVHKTVRFPQYFTENFKDLISSLIEKEPKNRIGA
jgi:hypothetical protein